VAPVLRESGCVLPRVGLCAPASRYRARRAESMTSGVFALLGAVVVVLTFVRPGSTTAV